MGHVFFFFSLEKESRFSFFVCVCLAQLHIVLRTGSPVQPARSTATAAAASARLMHRGCHRAPAALQARTGGDAGS